MNKTMSRHYRINHLTSINVDIVGMAMFLLLDEFLATSKLKSVGALLHPDESVYHFSSLILHMSSRSESLLNHIAGCAEDEDTARQAFEIFGLDINCSRGQHYLSGFIGSAEKKEEWLVGKLEKWTAVVVTLSTIAECYTQTAYAGFTFSMENEWQYVQRVVTDTLLFFSPLEEVIHKHFLPTLLGVPSVEINGEYHQILTHSVKLGGVAIHNPVDTALSVHKASLAATRHLTVSFVDPATQFDLGAHCMCATEAGLAAQRDRLQNELIFLNHRSQDKPAVARRDKRNCGAGTWLYVFPNQLNGNGLLANEWRNSVRLRYNHFPLDMPAACDDCGAKMTVEHALSCKTGGLVHIRHDDDGGACVALYFLPVKSNVNPEYFLV